jgi:hypothetical protein
MAIAHVCIGCGSDLARLRPRREPHYGLNLVTCPGCGLASVRRRHPVWSGWRRGRRAGVSIVVLAARLIITLFLSALNVFAALGLLALYNDMQRGGSAPPGYAAFFVLMLGLLALVTGVWLTAGFEHIARWKVVIGWLAWMALILVVLSLHGPLGRELDPRGWLDHAPSVTAWIAEGLQHVAMPATFAAGLMLLAALPGIFLGHGLLWLTRLVRRARWRANYRRQHLATNYSWD